MSTLSNIFISIDFCSLLVLLCCRFVKTKFIHITQGKFNGTKLVAWLPHCLGSNPEKYQQMNHIHIKTDDWACRLAATSGGSPLVYSLCATNCQIGYGTRSIRVAFLHHSDVITGAMASQITNLTIVYSTVNLDADQRKHQSPESLAFVRGIHRWPVNSPHKGPVTRKMSPFHDVIMSLNEKASV